MYKQKEIESKAIEKIKSLIKEIPWEKPLKTKELYNRMINRLPEKEREFQTKRIWGIIKRLVSTRETIRKTRNEFIRKEKQKRGKGERKLIKKVFSLLIKKGFDLSERIIREYNRISEKDSIHFSLGLLGYNQHTGEFMLSKAFTPFGINFWFNLSGPAEEKFEEAKEKLKAKGFKQQEIEKIKKFVKICQDSEGFAVTDQSMPFPITLISRSAEEKNKILIHENEHAFQFSGDLKLSTARRSSIYKDKVKRLILEKLPQVYNSLHNELIATLVEGETLNNIEDKINRYHLITQTDDLKKMAFKAGKGMEDTTKKRLEKLNSHLKELTKKNIKAIREFLKNHSREELIKLLYVLPYDKIAPRLNKLLPKSQKAK